MKWASEQNNNWTTSFFMNFAWAEIFSIFLPSLLPLKLRVVENTLPAWTEETGAERQRAVW